MAEVKCMPVEYSLWEHYSQLNLVISRDLDKIQVGKTKQLNKIQASILQKAFQNIPAPVLTSQTAPITNCLNLRLPCMHKNITFKQLRMFYPPQPQLGDTEQNPGDTKLCLSPWKDLIH